MTMMEALLMNARDYSALLTRIGRLERRLTKPDNESALELYTLKAAAIAVAEGHAKPGDIDLGGRI
jgi:acyl-CoA-binding protein